MKTRHTPGPWLIAGSNFVYALHEHKGLPVNRFSAAIDHYPSQGGNGEEGLANARLIAAAPDLLDALRLLLAECEYQSTLGNFNDNRFEISKARAAIAKATREQP